MKILIEILDCLRNYKTIGNLNVSDLNDELVKICIAQTTNVVTAESMIKLLHSDVHKIDSYMLIGKLKQAYLMAVKLNRVDDVLRIRAAAQESGQDAIQRICDMWLNNRKVPFASNEKVT